MWQCCGMLFGMHSMSFVWRKLCAQKTDKHKKADVSLRQEVARSLNCWRAAQKSRGQTARPRCEHVLQLMRVDDQHVTRLGTTAICGMRPCASASPIRCLSGIIRVMDGYVSKIWDSFWKLNGLWPPGALYNASVCACHQWPPDCDGFLLKPFAFFPRRQKTQWHQDERQAKKRRNGAENWWEIKWIDKVWASEKKMGKWIDCSRRERKKKGGEGGRLRRVMLLIHRSCRKTSGRCTPFLPQSATGRHTLQWQPCDHGKHKNTAFISSLTKGH